MNDLVLDPQKKPTAGPEETQAAGDPPNLIPTGSPVTDRTRPGTGESTEPKTTQGALAEKTSRPEDFPHFESVLVSRLGVSRDVIREKRRAAIQGAHWAWIGGNRVQWSEAGVNWLARALRATRSDRGPEGCPEPVAAGGEQEPHAEAALPAEKREIEPAPQIENFTVVRTFRNPRLILATDGQREFRVRVRDSKNFVLRMVIPCRHVQGDVWELARACPRWRGKW